MIKKLNLFKIIKYCNIVKNYNINVINHYENPRNVGSLDKTLKNVGTGLVGTPIVFVI